MFFAKKTENCLQKRIKDVPLHPKSIGLWCNGNTADSGPAFPGSSPGSPTEKPKHLAPAFLFIHTD